MGCRRLSAVCRIPSFSLLLLSPSSLPPSPASSDLVQPLTSKRSFEVSCLLKKLIDFSSNLVLSLSSVPVFFLSACHSAFTPPCCSIRNPDSSHLKYFIFPNNRASFY
ncbi:hypothetical protein F4781DRAFT_411929 [Annulohypoxylon bovei var. microspora]|nr:hypothetical protein F4781DRAFT_411929 [Annulohypoxylon bovei var. microspora]